MFLEGVDPVGAGCGGETHFVPGDIHFADKGHAPRLRIYRAFRIIVDHEVIHYEQDAL
jgi:hypothetical protein